MNVTEKKLFDLASPYDVVVVRQHAREVARGMGFGLTDQTRIATAVSEVARRALENQGRITFAVISDGTRQGVECLCEGAVWSEPPGGTPPGEFLGGLRGIERLMDEFELRDQRDGPVVRMRKWLRLA